MLEELNLIEKQIKNYQNEAMEYILKYSTGLNKFCLPSEDGKRYSFPSEVDLVFLAKNKVYPYIKNGAKILSDEFSKRVNYYSNLSKEDSFVGLQFKLYENINELYSLVDIDEALLIEDLPTIEGSCINAIKNLKTEYLSVNYTNYYGQIIDKIKDKANFHTLNFNKTCDEISYEIENTTIYREDNMLDIRKVIAQYESLEQPISVDLINEFPALIKDNVQYCEIHTNYITNKDKLKNLLMKDFEQQGLSYFYLFDRLCTCSDDKDCRFRCFNCFISTVLVLSYLRKYIEDSNGSDPSISEDKLMQIVCLLKPYLQAENQKQNELTNTLQMLKIDPVELKIIKLVAEGLSNPQIAERIYHKREKQQQIKNRLTTIYQKLAVKYPDIDLTNTNKRAKLAEFYNLNKNKD